MVIKYVDGNPYLAYIDFEGITNVETDSAYGTQGYRAPEVLQKKPHLF